MTPAENAWKVAMEAARAEAASMDYPKAAPTNEEAEAYDDMAERIADYLPTLPMPPAFRAEVEAEAEELREALGRIRDETLMGVSHGLGDRIYSIASGALSRLEAKGKGHE